MSRDWRGWLCDAGIVAFFAALPAAACTGSAEVGLALLAAFAVLTVGPAFAPRRRGK